jgi:hypothetical protein
MSRVADIVLGFTNPRHWFAQVMPKFYGTLVWNLFMSLL